MAPTLQDFQFWYGVGSDGKLFGELTNIGIVRVQGLHSFSVRSGNRLMPRHHGAAPGLHLMDQKIITFELEIPDRTEYLDFLKVFKVMERKQGELHWKLPDIPQSFHRARVAARTEEQTGLTLGLIPVTVGFECADPRVYSVDSKSMVLKGYNPVSGGIDWDIDWDVDFTESISTGGQDIVARNDGAEDAYPIIRVYGPADGTCEAVKFVNVTTGIELEIETPLLINQVLTADMDARIRGLGETIVHIDGSSRYGDWKPPRRTFYLAPGDNIIRFTMEGTSGDVLATMNWRDTSS